MMKKILPILALFTVILAGCKDDEPGTPKTSGTVLVDLTNVVGSVNLDETGATWYTNAAGESFNVTRLKYYLSNFELIRNDEVKYTLDNGYFLVDESNQATTVLELPDVPPGQYDKIRFLIGVDSTRNVSGAQTGALDPANGMFWTWSTGYIFYKLEGKSPASANVDSTFNYHIAGFRESNNTNSLRWVELWR
ncbi:MAG: MbnP family protein [Bacteroidota bacterium]